LGAAAADALFAVVAAYGLSFVSEFLLTHQKWLRLGGGILLLLLGIKHLLSKPPAPDVAEPRRSLVGDMASAFVLTITNPITIKNTGTDTKAINYTNHIHSKEIRKGGHQRDCLGWNRGLGDG